MAKFLVLENFISEPSWKAPVDVKVSCVYNENLVKILKRTFRHNRLTLPFCLDKDFRCNQYEFLNRSYKIKIVQNNNQCPNAE